jgi:hypothetical protein
MMPRSQAFDATTTPGPQTPINLDFLPIAATTVALWVAGGATFTGVVEVTTDDVNDEGVEPRWFPLEGSPTTGTGYTKFFEPWRWLRLNIELITGAVELKVAQAAEQLHRG